MNIKSFIKIFDFLFLISFSFCLFSCASNNAIVPGEEQILVENIYIEYSNIGDTYFGLEDYTNAAKYYKMSMQNRKIYWSSYYKLAKTYAYNSDWENALPMYKKILNRDPDNSSIKASLAYIYSMQGKFKDAEKIFEELLTVEPDNEKYIENYAAILMTDKDSYLKNKDKVDELIASLKENYPNNKNLSNFEKTITKFTEEKKKTGEKEEKTESDENQS